VPSVTARLSLRQFLAAVSDAAGANKPGEYDGIGSLPTLTQAIALAGGMRDSGDNMKVVLTRHMPGNQRKAYLVNFIKPARGKKPTRDTTGRLRYPIRAQDRRRGRFQGLQSVLLAILAA
jgi:protein involved in polysaccharide export with SLBB domain